MRRGAALLSAAVAAIGLALLAAGCGTPTVGSGKLVTKTYDFKDFTQLVVSHAFEIEVTRGTGYKIEVTVDDNLVDRLRVEQSGSTVRIGLDNVMSLGTTTQRAVVTLPDLQGLELSGACRADVSGFTAQKKLAATISGASSATFSAMTVSDTQLDVSGASKVSGDVKADELSAVASGASQIDLTGLAAEGVLEASGASKLRLGTFQFGTVTVKLSGASSAQINASKTIAADVTGASRLEYSGQANIREIESSGASTIKRVD